MTCEGDKVKRRRGRHGYANGGSLATGRIVKVCGRVSGGHMMGGMSESSAERPDVRDGTPWRVVFAVVGVVGLISVLVGVEVVRTAPVRGAVRAYSELIAAANRGDLEAARAVCSVRFLAENRLKAADEGGIVGLPRGIHKNFRAWSVGDDVHLCPTNPRDRLRPVYRLVRESGGWRFDGLAGQLGDGGVFTQVELTGP